MSATDRGFSLIELLIVVAIVGIISAVAYPAYTSHVAKTYRTASTSCLMEYAQYMEQKRIISMAYPTINNQGLAGTLHELSCLQDVNSRYTFSASSAGQAFEVKAVPIIADAGCGTLTIDQVGVKGATGADGPAACWR